MPRLHPTSVTEQLTNEPGKEKSILDTDDRCVFPARVLVYCVVHLIDTSLNKLNHACFVHAYRSLGTNFQIRERNAVRKCTNIHRLRHWNRSRHVRPQAFPAVGVPLHEGGEGREAAGLAVGRRRPGAAGKQIDAEPTGT